MALTFGPEGGIDTLNGRIVVSYGGQLHYADDGAIYDPDAGYANTFSNFTLGPAKQEGQYIVRGDYRMPGIVGQRQGGGQLEYRDASGQWRPVGGGLGNYDPRQDSDAQGSNERLQFDWAFANAPEGSDIRTMRQMAIDSGWTEPDRSNNEGTFSSFLEAAAPGILAVAGIGLMANAGMLGAMGGAEAGAAATASSEAATLAAGDAMAGLIPAGELGAWTGAAGGLGTGGSNMGIFDDLLSQWTDVPVDATQFADQSIVDLFNNAGTEGFNNLGVSYEDLAAELFNNAGTPGFDQLGNEATGLEWLKSQLGGPGSNTSTIQNAIKALTSGGGATGTGGSSLLGGGGSLLGAGLGGLAGLLGGAKQAGTTDVTQTPWGPQQQFLLDAWAKAKAASEANNPLRNQAESNYQSVLQGPTKNPMLGLDNPYLQTQIDNANNDVTRAMMPAMIQANKASGSFGNSGVADIYGKAMTDAYSKNANDMRYKDYYAQQQLQKDAVGNTLGFTTGSSQFNAAPAQDYAKTVQGSYGGTTSSPYFTNPASSMLGGATLGYNLFGGK